MLPPGHGRATGGPRAGQVRARGNERLSDHVALGVLKATFPPDVVDAVIAATGRREQRNRLLPAHLVVYYVLAMTFFSSSGYEEVMRSLTEGLSWVSDGAEHYAVPSQVAITKARARLGPEPLAELFARTCVPLASKQTPGAFYRDWRLVALDGTTIDVANTTANAEQLGRIGTGRGEVSAFPQLRVVGLSECGTHAVVAAAMGSCADRAVALAKSIVCCLNRDMLCLADLGFTADHLFNEAASTRAALVWRAKRNAVLPVLVRHADGSFGSELVASDDNGSGEQRRSVRVIEYPITDPRSPKAEGGTHRLVTTILDPDAAPAAELAALDVKRWRIESIFEELKANQRAPRVILRSRTPSGAYQEAWGYLCVHYALRALVHTAAGRGTP